MQSSSWKSWNTEQIRTQQQQNDQQEENGEIPMAVWREKIDRHAQTREEGNDEYGRTQGVYKMDTETKFENGGSDSTCEFDWWR